MSEYVWEATLNWKGLLDPCEGDIVHLKYTSGFTYLVKVIVVSVEGTKVTGVVESVFDGDGQRQVTGGASQDFMNKELTFAKKLIQKVIKKPKRSL